ncbi:glucokinase [Lipingzhangella halophila]|uniref:Glucokinase n=1 Tax=Lipingzhangella halophila TaxID=1783352 RepID=A0A7W7W1N9_9ACTN|nr:ROK family protein [Lipingzhangella halophila]MBB4931182.1 glucokinase [Lipingzhangella halophila]
MNAADQAVIGVDIGGTTILAAAVLPDGTASRHHTVPTPRTGGGDEVWEGVASAIDAALEDTSGAARGIGIASAGPLDRDQGTVSPVNIPAWRDYPLLKRARERYPGVAVAFDGDGLCMALGEHRYGAGRGSSATLGIVVSTGVGGGVVLDGRLYRGPSGNAGHIGHAIAEPDGEQCPCGSRGCVEVVASGPSMVRWALEHGWSAPGPNPDARALAESARAGGTVALRAFERSGRALGIAIVNAAALTDLDRVVVGGGVAQSGRLIFDPIRSTVAEYASMDFLRRLEVRASTLGQLAGLLGASELV